MRLIDADKILETMKNQLDMQNPCLPIHLKEIVTDAMPTAYDLDGVLKELREKTELAYRRYIDCPAESPIGKEEIERIRHRIKIGDTIPVEVQKIDWSTESMVFRQQELRCRVVGKYKHVIEVENQKTGRRYTTTYIDLLMKDRRLGA